MNIEDAEYKDLIKREQLSILLLTTSSAQLIIVNNIKDFDLDVKTAFSGKEVIDSVKSNNDYDIIFLESEILDTTLMLRKNNIFIPIIALVEDYSTEDIDSLLARGVTEVLKTQLIIESLESVLIDNLNKWKDIKSFLNFNQIEDCFFNNIDSYMDICSYFFDKYSDLTVDFLDKNSTHKLKGTSGTIGLHKIMKQALILEEDLTSLEKKDLLINTFSETKSCFYNIFSRSKEVEQFDLDKFISLLKDNNTDVLTYLLERKPSFKLYFGSNYEQLNKVVMILDFNSALKICKDITSKD